MSISTQLVVSSYAKDSTAEALPSQASAASNEIIFTNSMGTNNNGNVAGPPTDGTPTYAGRLIVVRLGDADEEVRYITAESGTGPYTCTVHEDWVVQPASGDTYFIFYGTTDMDTVGNNFKELLKRVTDWAASSTIEINSGGGFALLDGHSIETVDNGSTTAGDIQVKSGGRFEVGYAAGGTPVGGGYISATPATDGELALDVQSGGEANFNDFFLTCVKTNKTLFNGTSVFRNAKLFAAGYTQDMTGTIELYNVTIAGRGTSNEYTICDATTTVDGLILVSSYGLTSPDDATTETITIKNVTFVNMQQYLYVHDNKTWEIINPTWSPDESSQNDILFENGTSNIVKWLWSLDIFASSAAGSAYSGVSINIYEGTNAAALVTAGSPLQTDSNGLVSTTILDRTYEYLTSTTLTTTSYGAYVLRGFYHGYTPVISSLTLEPLDINPIFLVDPYIVQTTAATAISNGPTSDPTPGTNPNTLLFFDTGSGTITAGETITGGTSGATGVVEEVSEGDNTSGKMFLKSRNATAFQQNESLSSTSWTGAVIDNATFKQDFTWWIDGEAKSLQTLYDWQSAELANSTLSSAWQAVHEWAKGNLGYIIQAGGSGFYTERSGTEGVFITDRGAGTLAYLTADDGTTWTPAATVTIQVTVLDDSTGLPIENARVLLYKDSDKTTQVLNGGTNSSGIVSAPYAFTTSFDVVGWARQWDLTGDDYTPKDISGTVTSAGLYLTVRLIPI